MRQALSVRFFNVLIRSAKHPSSLLLLHAHCRKYSSQPSQNENQPAPPIPPGGTITISFRDTSALFDLIKRNPQYAAALDSTIKEHPKVQRSLDKLRNYMNKHPEYARAVGVDKSSPDANNENIAEIVQKMAEDTQLATLRFKVFDAMQECGILQPIMEAPPAPKEEAKGKRRVTVVGDSVNYQRLAGFDESPASKEKGWFRRLFG
ncbi:hypothetical protein BJ742DRAFT_782041 [Cladochytrium replicatum]|nr:hypothetical protein BJ742DRAFT_782041 [Cladochytrium replicatum]